LFSPVSYFGFGQEDRLALGDEMKQHRHVLRELNGELLDMLEQDPIDAEFFHETVYRLLREKIDLLERLKLRS
jgi:hypothetical protein